MYRQMFLKIGFLCALLVTFFVVGLVKAQAYNEAPMLAERVEAGELPPVEERLPANPLVVEPHERIGQYGGTWNFVLRRGDWSVFSRNTAYENLVRWDPEWTTVIPNIAESFEFNEDATEFTFYLREGMKWSDGHPFTADDIVFWYEDLQLDAEITPVISDVFMAGGEPGVVEKLDDYTVKISFVEPHGLFLQYLATQHGNLWSMTASPKHYLQQFHPAHNPDADALAAEKGYPSAIDFLATHLDITSRYNHGDTPVLWAWYLTSNNPWDRSQVVKERNPYYFKIDPQGNQLPYIDRVAFNILDDVEAIILRALNGEQDFSNRYLALEEKPLFFDYMERGNFHLMDVFSSHNNVIAISLNLTHEDPVLREIFQNKDFRIGLSHAIDRQEIIDLIFVGQTEPWQLAPRPGNLIYNERLGTQYLEYDVDLANEYLDRVVPERDAEGFRLRPDGNRVSFSIDTAEGRMVHFIDILDLMSTHWREVGIDMRVNVIERTFFVERKGANLHDGAVWNGDGGTEALLEPRWYFPYSNESNFAIPWANWYLDAPGPKMEPPEAARRQMDLYDQVRATADAEEQIRLMNEILEIAADEFYAMGIGLPPTEFAVVTNRFKNVPDSMHGSWLWPTPAPLNPEQFFIEE